MSDPIDRRLGSAVRLFLQTNSTLAALSIKLRDDDSVITPESDAAKAPRIIVDVSDTGRTARYAPIRSLRVEILLRQNAKIAANTATAFAALAGTLELLLDQANLTTALDSAALGVRVMLATRQNGNMFRADGDLRLQSWVLDVRAVKSELTV